jgi:bifunctional pyridoxal-dependent enzyme with beta-cystathionase and maltose regulon repressor activities
MNEGSASGPGGEGFMRMNLAATHRKVRQAMEQIGKAVASQR